jgi:hypothetical protein
MGSLREQIADVVRGCYCGDDYRVYEEDVCAATDEVIALVDQARIEECAAGAVVEHLPTLLPVWRPRAPLPEEKWIFDLGPIPIAAAPGSLAEGVAGLLAERKSPCQTCRDGYDDECANCIVTPKRDFRDPPPFAAAYTDHGGKRTYTLASCAGGADVGNIAARYGGSGTERSATFEVLFADTGEHARFHAALRRAPRLARVSIRDWQREIHAYAKDKGWWAEDRNFGEMVALMHSELTEALEEWRNGRPMVYNGEGGKPEGIAIEMADCVIRILDWAEREGVDIGEVMATKHAYNLRRPHRHGGKRC